MQIDGVTTRAIGTLVAAILGCSLPNPAFDEGAQAGTGGDDTGRPGSGSSAVTTENDPSASDTTATSATTPSTSGDETTKGDDDDTKGDPSETGTPRDVAATCADGPGAPIELSVVDLFTGVPIECGDLEVVVDLDVTDAGASLVLLECDGECPCGAPRTGYEIRLEEQLVDESAAGCRLVRIWTAPSSDGSCDWAGLAIYPVNEGAPLFAAANRAGAPASVLGGGPMLAGGAICPELTCDDPIRPPGLYALQLEGVLVWPDDPMTAVPFENVTYDFDNRMSHIGADCHEHVSWLAQLQ